MTYFTTGTNRPKNPLTAMGLIYGHVKSFGLTGATETQICAAFVRDYTSQYAGKETVDMGFARGYFNGAIREGVITEVSVD